MAPGVVEVALRRVRVSGRLRKRRHVDAVLACRRFRAAGELDVISRYVSELEELRGYAIRDALGAWVETVPARDGRVRVRLIERRFDGEQVRTDVHADRAFDATAEDAVAVSAAFAAELGAWAEQRNAVLEEAQRTASDDRERAHAEAASRDREARELAEILARAGR